MKIIKKAFTLVELLFVIVIMGILLSVAIPKLSVTTDDAHIAKAINTIASVRTSLAVEKQKRIMRGNSKPITRIGDATNVFGNFYDADGDTGVSVLDYPIKSEAKKFHWRYYVANHGDIFYMFYLKDTYRNNRDVIFFKVRDGKFLCIEQRGQGFGSCSKLKVQANPRS